MRDLGKFIAVKGFKKLPKVQKIVQSGHTACDRVNLFTWPVSDSQCSIDYRTVIKTLIEKLPPLLRVLFVLHIFCPIGAAAFAFFLHYTD